MRQARIAILGQGRSGRDIHGACFHRNPDAYQVVAVIDPLEERRVRAAEEWPGADILESHTQLYGRTDIDLVVNSTPSHYHVPVTMDLLSHGLNVLCEKPLARYPYEIDQMVREARKNNVFFAPFQQSRNCAYYRKLLEVVDSGVLGRLVQISVRANGFGRRWDWQTLQENNAGSLLNTGPHAMDQCLNLLGFPEDPMPEVFSALDRVNTFGDAEDFVKVLLKTPGKPVVDYEINCADAFPPYLYHLTGQYGTFTCTASQAKWKYFVPAEAPEQHLIRTPLFTADRTPAYCGEKLVWHEGSWNATEFESNVINEATELFYQNLMPSLFDGAPLKVTPQQVRLQIAIMAQVHEQNPLSRIR